MEPGDHLPQRRREVLIVTLHGLLPAIPGMVALFRAVQMIVRTRLTDRERPFSVIGPAPCEMSVEGIDAHDMTRALLALRIDEGTRLALINFHLMLLFLSGASREIQKTPACEAVLQKHFMIAALTRRPQADLPAVP